MTLYSPCISSSGPSPAKIAIIGEAPGESEESQGVPFIGYSGKLLDDMLSHAGIDRADCFLTNVLFTRPPSNKIESFCVKRTEPGALTEMPPLLAGRYLKDDFRPELERLFGELRACRPNLIILLGNTACWAVLQKTYISKIRGTIVESRFGKCLPTYHPAAITRQWDLRPIVMADLIKAKLEMDYPEIRRPRREIIIDPTFPEIRAFIERCVSARVLAVDIETRSGQITCIGFARSREEALVIPFVDDRKPGRSYWPSAVEELKAWNYVKELLGLPQPKVLQNGLYDVQYLRKMKLHIHNQLHDSMILHHAMHPEMLKGLGFLGSIYTLESSWKIMRQRGEDQLKRDE